MKWQKMPAEIFKALMNKYGRLFSSCLLASVCLALFFRSAPAAQSRTVLLELYTSEACDSCPPAEKILSNIKRTMPGVIVLGEHIDYWDSQAWKDPFSLNELSHRQQNYCQKLGISSVYTPQAVISGKYECNGANENDIREAIGQASQIYPATINMSFSRTGQGLLRVQASIVGLKHPATMILFVVQDGVEIKVTGGENSGRQLQHDGVVRMLKTIAGVTNSSAVSESFVLPADTAGKNLRLVAVLENDDGLCAVGEVTVK